MISCLMRITSRSQPRSTATNFYGTVATAQDVITFYNKLLDAPASEVMPSVRTWMYPWGQPSWVRRLLAI